MAVVVVVLEPGREPLLDDAVVVDHVVGHLGEHLFPDGDLVLVAPEFAGGGDHVAQQFLGHRDVHGGVEGRLGVRVARRVFRRLGRREDELAVRPLVEVVLEEHDRLFHERQGVFGEEFTVAGVEVVVVEEVGRPAGAADPHAAGEVWRPGRC